MATFTFGKQEKLKRRKLIEQVFAEGKSIAVPPLRLVYIQSPGMDVTIQAGVSVSTRNFKKAVHRNRVKRILREAYRLNKNGLTEHLAASGKHLALFILYNDKTLPVFTEINQKMQLLLNKLIKATSEAATKDT
jgi:ribonuclease P protein component